MRIVRKPYTFVLRPDLRIHAIYNGWFFVGRPTLEELRRDLRAIIEQRADYRYEAYDTPEVRQVRIPQQEWINGTPPNSGEFQTAYERVLFPGALGGEAKLEDTGIRHIRQCTLSCIFPHLRANNQEILRNKGNNLSIRRKGNGLSFLLPSPLQEGC